MDPRSRLSGDRNELSTSPLYVRTISRYDIDTAQDRNLRHLTEVGKRLGCEFQADEQLSYQISRVIKMS